MKRKNKKRRVNYSKTPKTSECTCLKCHARFQSSEEADIAGDGWCATCLETKQAIAKKIDAKFANRPPEKRLQRLDELPTIRGINGMNYINARDLF